MEQGRVSNNPFAVAPQDKTRGRFVWQSDEELQQWPRMSFVAAASLAENKALSKDIVSEQLLPALHVLPERCFTSPIVSMFTYDTKTPWVLLVKTTLVVLWELMQIRLWFYTKQAVASKNKDKRGIALGRRLQQYRDMDFPAWEDAQDLALDSFFRDMKADGVVSMDAGDRAKQWMDKFATLMRKQTFSLIHILERLVYDCGVIYSNGKKLRFMPSCTDLVPVDYLYDSEKMAANETLNMQSFFQNKQCYLVANDRLDQRGNLKPEDQRQKDIYHIEYDVICKIMNEKRADAAQVYQKYIPYYTLWQYAMLLDGRGNHILGEASRGLKR